MLCDYHHFDQVVFSNFVFYAYDAFKNLSVLLAPSSINSILNLTDSKVVLEGQLFNNFIVKNIAKPSIDSLMASSKDLLQQKVINSFRNHVSTLSDKVKEIG